MSKRSLRRGGAGAIPFGPGEPFENVADVPLKLVVIDRTDGDTIKQKLQYFNNDGVDFVDFGRPSNVVDHIRPSIDQFTMRFLAKPANAVDGALMSLSTGAATPAKFAVETNTLNQLKIFVGGLQTIFTGLAFTPNVWSLFVLKYTTTQVRLFINGVKAPTTGNVGTGQHDRNLLLFGDFSSTVFNYAGGGGFVDFYSGVGDFNSHSVAGQTELDCFDFTKPALWDGGPTMVSENGTVGTFTKGVPLTERQFDLIPRSILC